MKDKIINFFKGLGTILLYFIIAGCYGTIFSEYYTHSNIIIAYASQLGLYFTILIIMALLYSKRLINDFKNFKKENINIALKNWLIGLGFMLLSNLIVTFLIKNIATNESLNRELLTNYPLSNIITMIFIGPLIEEITFRASFKNAFSKWYTFAIVTAFFFAFVHIAKFTWTEFLFMIPYGTLGFFFAKAFYETDNIYTSFIAHMIHNACAVLLIMTIL